MLRKPRFFTRINTPTCSFRAEYSHCFILGQSVSIFMKSIIKPKINIPENCFKKQGKYWVYPINDKYFSNNFIKVLLCSLN